MFFKKSSSALEIEKSVTEHLPPPQSEEDDFQAALQSLASSAELFEALDLPEEAEVITQFMETIASGQFAMVKEAKKKAKKKKSKVKKKPTKKTNRFSKDLHPEKQVKNLEEVGWVFNAPCNDCDDENMADDEVFEAELIDPPDQDKQYGLPLEERIRRRETRGEPKKERELPADYEKCEECKYDHIYEPEEAWRGHFPEKINQEFDGQEDLERAFPSRTIDV